MLVNFDLLQWFPFILGITIRIFFIKTVLLATQRPLEAQPLLPRKLIQNLKTTKITAKFKIYANHLDPTPHGSEGGTLQDTGSSWRREFFRKSRASDCHNWPGKVRSKLLKFSKTKVWWWSAACVQPCTIIINHLSKTQTLINNTLHPLSHPQQKKHFSTTAAAIHYHINYLL